jgi:hypothetical protein
MALACAIAFLLQAQETAVRVAEQVGRLNSDDPDVRRAATDELVRIGRRAIPTLEATKTDDVEVRYRIAQAIGRIQTTDPWFLMRSPERRVSVSFRDLPVPEAHDRAFAGFPFPPVKSLSFSGSGPVSMTAHQAGYWEVVEMFAAAAKARLSECSVTTGIQFADGHPNPSFRFVRHGRYLFEGWAGKGRIEIRLHAEPGLQPVAISFKMGDVTDGPGKSLLKGMSEEPSGSWYGTPYALGNLAVYIRRGALLEAGTEVTVEGTALVDLAADVETAEFRGGVETRSLSEWRLTMERLTLNGSLPNYSLIPEELKGWKAPEQRSYLGIVWLIASDDEGRSQVVDRMRYGIGGKREKVLGWDLPGRPTRLTFVRPTAIERLEIPVRLRGMVIAP